MYNKEIFKKAIIGSLGNYSVIARRVGCDWHTAKKWIVRDDELSQLFEDERETNLDLAENKLLQKIQDGDFPAIKFFLSTQGAARGYVKKTETRHIDLNKVQLDKLSMEQLEQLAAGDDPDIILDA